MKAPILEAITRGIAFIEANLHEEIGVSDVADAVHYSQFYFSREFTRHTHFSVYDYILRRKLSQAYAELLRRQCRIVDLAFRYGFQSHEVFTRAFRKLFGENPSETAVCKPLAMLEPIDGPYLDFLSGLRVEPLPACLRDCHFTVTGAAADWGAVSAQCHLVIFDTDNLFRQQCILQGRLRGGEPETLSIPLQPLCRAMRIHHTDPVLAFRYYADHLHDPALLGGNFVLLQAEEACLDLLIPQAADRPSRA